MRRGVLVGRSIAARRRRPVLLTLVVVAFGVVEARPASSAKPVWSISAFPSPAGSTTTVLEGVTCPSAKSCFAVGYAQVAKTNQSLVEHWDGSKWSRMTSVNPAGSSNTRLFAVSCASTTNCFAVGGYTQVASLNSLIEHWDGSSWSIITSPSAAGWANQTLGAVSCATATSCIAAGHYLDNTGRSLVEQWDGNSWSIMTIASVPGSTETELFGVTCPSATSCVAVGFYQPSAGASNTSLVEQWDGSSWSVVPSPVPKTAGPTQAGLGGVSCASPTDCFGVGSYASAHKSLVQRSHGSSWSVVASPNPTGSDATYPDAVSCPSAASCFAVGRYFPGVTSKALVERWAAGKWSVMTGPNLAAPTSGWFKGVACSSSTSCFAVGTRTIKGVTKALIERYA